MGFWRYIIILFRRYIITFILTVRLAFNIASLIIRYAYDVSSAAVSNVWGYTCFI